MPFHTPLPPTLMSVRRLIFIFSFFYDNQYSECHYFFHLKNLKTKSSFRTVNISITFQSCIEIHLSVQFSLEFYRNHHKVLIVMLYARAGINKFRISSLSFIYAGPLNKP